MDHKESPWNFYCFCPRNWITELLNRNDDILAPFFSNYLKKFSRQSVPLKVVTTSSKFVGKENDWWGQNFQLNLAAMSHLWNVGQRSKINFPGFNFFSSSMRNVRRSLKRPDVEFPSKDSKNVSVRKYFKLKFETTWLGSTFRNPFVDFVHYNFHFVKFFGNLFQDF